MSGRIEGGGSSWWSWCCCCGGTDEDEGMRRPLTAEKQDGSKTPDGQRRVVTPGHTPTKSPTVKGETLGTNQWD